jgi:hypothetical protein
MSDATVRPGGSANPTRQQLDDLEALMQRMLALPVNQGDDDVPSVEASVLATDTALPRNDESSPENPWQPVGPAVETVVSEAGPTHVPALREGPSIAVIASPFIGAKPSVGLGRVRSPWPRWILPVLWINRLFDTWTTQLGRPGRWLRSRQGRALLGALGLLFLITAMCWTILAFVGWTW